MPFLTSRFWCLLTFLAAIFTYGNWDRVEVHLWGGLVADVNLPLLLLVTFLLGLLPTLVYHHAVRWRLRQRVANAERTVADLRAVTLPVAVIEPMRTPIDPLAEPARPLPGIVA